MRAAAVRRIGEGMEIGHGDLGIYTHAVPGKSDLSDQWEKLQGKKSAPARTQ
jgi:hypothetical protein